MKGDYFLEKKTSSGRRSLEGYKLIAKATARRNGISVKKMIGVEVIGMVTCPCAMETIRANLNGDYSGKPDVQISNL
jgi:GTP cyclohydrolase FolE2